jgi:hypothetical protein
MSMTFSDDASERRGRGHVKLRERKTSKVESVRQELCAMANAYTK